MSENGHVLLGALNSDVSELNCHILYREDGFPLPQQKSSLGNDHTGTDFLYAILRSLDVTLASALMPAPTSDPPCVPLQREVAPRYQAVTQSCYPLLAELHAQRTGPWPQLQSASRRACRNLPSDPGPLGTS